MPIYIKSLLHSIYIIASMILLFSLFLLLVSFCRSVPQTLLQLHPQRFQYFQSFECGDWRGPSPSVHLSQGSYFSEGPVPNLDITYILPESRFNSSSWPHIDGGVYKVRQACDRPVGLQIDRSSTDWNLSFGEGTNWDEDKLGNTSPEENWKIQVFPKLPLPPGTIIIFGILGHFGTSSK